MSRRGFPYVTTTMDLDDDAPPELIDTAIAEEPKEEVTVKVPITIVTGMSDFTLSFMPGDIF